jgi:hypothetical protein
VHNGTWAPTNRSIIIPRLLNKKLNVSLQGSFSADKFNFLTLILANVKMNHIKYVRFGVFTAVTM